MSPPGRPTGEYRSAQRDGTPVSHLTRGPVRSTGIGSQANAFGGRRASESALRQRFSEAEA